MNDNAQVHHRKLHHKLIILSLFLLIPILFFVFGKNYQKNKNQQLPAQQQVPTPDPAVPTVNVEYLEQKENLNYLASSYKSYIYHMEKVDVAMAEKNIRDALMAELKNCNCLQEGYPERMETEIKTGPEQCESIGVPAQPSSVSNLVTIYLLPQGAPNKVDATTKALYIGDPANGGSCLLSSSLISHKQVVDKALQKIGVKGFEHYD